MICGSTCAGCARCPTCCHGRQARAPCVARCARKWPGPCSRCRGRAIGTSSRWKCCRSSAMPIRISIRKPRPRLAPARDRARRDVRQPADRTLPGHAAPAPGTQRGDPRRHGRARAPVAVSRAGRRLRVGTRRCARAWITPPTRAAAPACGADPRQTPALCQRGAVAAQSIPQARALRQGPGRRARRRWAARRTSRQPPRWGAMCVSLSTGRLAGRQGDKAALRLLRRAGDGLRSASRRLLRRPSFWAQASRGRVARRLPAGAEAPRATA